MSQPRPAQGHKIKRRKLRYIRFDTPWEGIHKETRKRANRRVRRAGGVILEARATRSINPPQGKQEIAGNRCGNECGRRAIKGDYLCVRCRG